MYIRFLNRTRLALAGLCVCTRGRASLASSLQCVFANFAKSKLLDGSINTEFQRVARRDNIRDKIECGELSNKRRALQRGLQNENRNTESRTHYEVEVIVLVNFRSLNSILRKLSEIYKN